MRKAIQVKTVLVDLLYGNCVESPRKYFERFDNDINNLFKEGFELYSISSTTDKDYACYIATLVKYKDEE